MTNGNDLAFDIKENVHTTPSLTKREYFAAMAIQGLALKYPGSVNEVANRAVQLADALIDELNK